MKLRYFLTSIIACLALAIGCTKEELPALSEITVTPSYFTFTVDGGAKELTVNALADWTVTDIPEWLTVAPAEGTATGAEGVKVTVTAQATQAEKVVTATLKFNCAGKIQLVTVGQEAYVPDYPKFEAGEYWIMFGDEVALPVSSSYGYLYTGAANKSQDGKLSSTADNIFTFTAVEGGFSIQDAAGKYYAMKGTYTSFNLYDSAQESYVFTVKQTGDDKFVITNANGKVMQYDPAYSSAGAYDTEKSGAIYPNLVSVAGAEIPEVLFAVEPTEVEVEKAGADFNINMTCKTGEFEIEPSVDWITLKGMTSTNGEYVVTFACAENTEAARTGAIEFTSGEETITVTVNQEGSIAEITVAEFLDAEEGEVVYQLTGKISNITYAYSAQYGNISFNLMDATGEVNIYRMSCAGVENPESLRVGDIVTVQGKRSSHNENPQMAAGGACVNVVGSTDVTVAEFLDKEASSNVWYRLTGTVDNIQMDKNDPTKENAYGNFDLVDGEYSVLVYGLTVAPVAKNDRSFSTLGLKAGDIVTIVGTRDAFNETKQVGGPAYYISHTPGETGGEEGGDEGGDEGGEDPTEKTARNLAFSPATATATLGEAFTAPTLNGETAGVVYSSSDEEVATVDAATGAVTLVAAGETIITAAAEETETLQAGSAIYTLTVSAAAVEPVEPVLADGTYWIVANGNVATPLTSNYGYLKVTNGKNNPATNGFTFTYVSEQDAYTIQDNGGQYYYQSGTYDSYNRQATLPETGAYWKVEKADNNTYKITNLAVNKFVQYDPSYNSYGSYATQKGKLPELVSVVGNAIPYVVVDPSALSVEADKTSAQFTISADMPWTAEVTTGTATLSTTSGSADATVTVSFDANTSTTDSKQYTVTVKSAYGDKVVTISQSKVSTGSTVTDVLTAGMFAATSTTYTEFSGVKATSSAVYAGKSAKTATAGIQLRSNKGEDGIVTTASGGKVRRVVVTWASTTAAGRTLDIYGKNTAYTKATDLYDNQLRGTKLGSIVMGTSTILEISGDYDFVGFRSYDGAMYIEKIEVTYE